MSVRHESAVFALGNACDRMLRVPLPSRSRAAKSPLGTACMWHSLQVVAALSGWYQPSAPWPLRADKRNDP